jgi:hypothetical protein
MSYKIRASLEPFHQAKQSSLKWWQFYSYLGGASFESFPRHRLPSLLNPSGQMPGLILEVGHDRFLSNSTYFVALDLPSISFDAVQLQLMQRFFINYDPFIDVYESCFLMLINPYSSILWEFNFLERKATKESVTQEWPGWNTFSDSSFEIRFM